MFEYKYVDCRTGGGFFGGSYEHREIIAQHAQEGWRYVGFLPTGFTGHGGIAEVDLIFERTVGEE